MREMKNTPRFRQVVSLPPNIPLIPPKATGSAEYKPPNNRRAKVFTRRQLGRSRPNKNC